MGPYADPRSEPERNISEPAARLRAGKKTCWIEQIRMAPERFVAVQDGRRDMDHIAGKTR